VSRMRNLVIYYFVFKSQSHYIVAFMAKGLKIELFYILGAGLESKGY